MSDQARLDGGVGGGPSAIGLHSRIPLEPCSVREIESWIRIAGDDRAAIEAETHGREAEQGTCLRSQASVGWDSIVTSCPSLAELLAETSQ